VQGFTAFADAFRSWGEAFQDFDAAHDAIWHHWPHYARLLSERDDVLPESDYDAIKSLVKLYDEKLSDLDEADKAEITGYFSAASIFNRASEQARTVGKPVLAWAKTQDVRTDLAPLERFVAFPNEAFYQAAMIVVKVLELQLDLESESSPDGPFGHSRFRWHGEEFDGLPSNPYLLLDCLWKAPNRAAGRTEVEEAVWGHDQAVDWSQVKNVASDATSFLAKHRIPLRVTVNSRVGGVSIVSTESTDSAGRRRKKSKKNPSRY